MMHKFRMFVLLCRCYRVRDAYRMAFEQKPF